LIFVGPSADTIRRGGDKIEARRVAQAAGVPVGAGSAEVSGVDAALTVADAVGYPILLKAAAGGGGKGMRVVRSEADLAAALRAARSEAAAAFGDDGVYAEKFLEGVRHVEIQMIADAHGNAVSLGERECSLQRRHQKLIEESPSMAVDAELRSRMGALAVQVARASGYRNAGTVEFLLDAGGRPYFMEVNARIQVEHPVTEMVTGIDLVRAQIEVAAGAPLPFRQEEIRPRGWAIECRILAEDPAGGFRPHPGRITALRLPSGPGIRVDTALQPGDEISLHYDALVAKLVAWGADRDEAVRRMLRALREFQVAGIRTTIPFHIEVLEGGDFRAGRFDIAWVDRAMPALGPRLEAGGDDAEAAAVAAAVGAYEEARRAAPRAAEGAGAAANPWAMAGRRAQLRGRAPREPWA
jgi:acetyl-CoA carboxylase biotin carboxylase subunit